MRISIQDEPRPRSEIWMIVVLRASLGVALLAHGVGALARLGGLQALLEPGFWSRTGAALTRGQPDGVALVTMVIGLVAGPALVAGFWTRTCAFLAAALAVATAWSLALRAAGDGLSPGVGSLAGLDAPVLQLGIALFLLVVGAGEVSLDHALRERARRRAIAQDDLWLRPPYVSDKPYYTGR